MLKFVFFILFMPIIYGNITNLIGTDEEVKTVEFMTEIIRLNYKKNGWRIIATVGEFPNKFYENIQHLGTVLTNDLQENHYIESVPNYYINSIIISCTNLEDFEEVILKIREMPNWHPMAHVYVYLKTHLDKNTIAHIFYVLWYERVINAIIIRQIEESFEIVTFSPYAYDSYKLQYNMGCYLVNKIGLPVNSLVNDLHCEDTCENITSSSKYRSKHLGTCIGINYFNVKIGDLLEIFKLDLFEDKGKNLHGFSMRSYTTEVLPFLGIKENANGYTFTQRDGLIWVIMSEKMNFTFDLSPSLTTMRTFSFEYTIKQLHSFSIRQADLFIVPIYLVDLVFVKVDFSFPFKESGLCVTSQRAPFETITFDINIINENYILIIQFGFCFLGVWLTFIIFKAVENGKITLDQIGRDYLNSIRNVLTVSLHLPPRKRSFRIFLGISIWCFFILNFSMQAAIISLFAAIKRGQEVDTFEDMIEKGYIIEGMASPDVILPDTEEKYIKINSKFAPVNDLFECINRIEKSPQRFCLIDCSVGRYLERNKLNEKGEQYLHIASDRIHSLYLNFILHANSPLTNQFDQYLVRLVESGIIKKWEEYRYMDIKEDAVVKPLSMNELKGIYKSYWFLVANSCIFFGLELILGLVNWFKKVFIVKVNRWYLNVKEKRRLKKIKLHNKINLTNAYTQTFP